MLNPVKTLNQSLRPSGIEFDWISDPTAERDSLKNLLSVTGISSNDLDVVLSRVTSRANGASAVRQVDTPPGLAAPSRSNALAPPMRHLLPGAHASNPIVIDDNEPLAAAANPSQVGDALGPSYVQISPAVMGRQSFTNGTSASFAMPKAVSQRPFVTIAPEEVGVGSSTGQPRCNSRTFGNARSTEPQDALNPEAILPFIPAADTRASVVSYASSPRSDGMQEIDHDVTYGDQAAIRSNAQNRPGEENALHPRPRSRSVRSFDSTSSQRQLEKRRADYGNWQSLIGDSSDAEMEDVTSSSRESSPGRVLPPQAQKAVAGLSFFPKTYDVSGLVLPPMSAPGYLSGHASDSDASVEKHARLIRKRTQYQPSPVGRYGVEHGIADVSASASRSSNQTSARQELARCGRTRMNASNDENEDIGVISAKRMVPRDMPLPRASVPSRHQFRGRSGGSASHSYRKRDTSSGPSKVSHQRRPSSSGRAASESDESEREQLREQKGPAGHTVVIPKSEFARGRRLLAPGNQDFPIATILMRGDAHFIDQRRKTRITKWSLPVEDDLRHVEDACIIGESTIVVGYNKGPRQVSLIPVLEDQRPRRIDLTYKAHSTVIENRVAATSYPNPGIACLAPVSSDSFLSGGYDKTVRHWKVTPDPGQSAWRAAYSAGSGRLPTDHMQAVQALAFSSWNNAVYSAAGDRIATTRLDARAPAEPVRVSGKITQVHVHPQDPRLIALEIDHMDYQVHLYDTREGGFRRKPWLEFGYRAAPPKPRNASAGRPADAGNAFMPKQGSRYIRGSTVNSLFARGYGDGAVLVWDYRDGGKKGDFHFFSGLIKNPQKERADALRYWRAQNASRNTRAK
ncbi:hypothetical protein ACG7TL_003581 [Trametes sanguinea]